MSGQKNDRAEQVAEGIRQIIDRDARMRYNLMGRSVEGKTFEVMTPFGMAQYKIDVQEQAKGPPHPHNSIANGGRYAKLPGDRK